jgi:5-methylcytosine-specific restriction endonuclease McrA
MYDDLLDDPKVQRLSAEEFRSEFLRAVAGFGGAFDEWITVENGRLGWQEWAIVRLAVFERDDYTCRYCGVSGVKLECDHIMPISRGGSNDRSNLVTACQSCNRKKRDKTPEEMGWTIQ